jgi:hypothetical protein
MDDQERTYLLAQINAVERSRSHWRLTALASLGALVLAILLQGGVNILHGYRALHILEVQRREAVPREFAEEQRRAAEAQQKQQADAERAAKQRK